MNRSSARIEPSCANVKCCTRQPGKQIEEDNNEEDDDEEEEEKEEEDVTGAGGRGGRTGVGVAMALTVCLPASLPGRVLCGSMDRWSTQH